MLITNIRRLEDVSQRATLAKNLAASAGLLASTEAMRAFAAFVMRLIRTLHGISPAITEPDRYSTVKGVSRRRSPRGLRSRFMALPGVQLLSNLSCGVKRASATYAGFSPVDNQQTAVAGGRTRGSCG